MLGATGFLGGHTVSELRSSGLEVVAATRHDGDIGDPDALRNLVAATRPEAVINAAGMTSPSLAGQDPARCFEVNTKGMLNLLEAVRAEVPAARVVALSSAAVYAGEPPFDETSATAATNPYAASKLAMEVLCGQYRRGQGLPVTVLRCFNLTGPGEPASQVTTEFAMAALGTGPEGRAEVTVGEPATARDYTDVRDAARAIRLLLESDPAAADLERTFNLCSGKATSLRELARTIGDLAGVELALRGSGTGRPASGLLCVRGDGRQLARATGWQPVTGLERSLGDLLESLRP